MRRALFPLLALLALPVSAVAQAPVPPSDGVGRITGVVADARTGAPLDGAIVQVAATGAQAVSGADGRYVLDGVAVGAQTLLASVVGYALLLEDVTVPAGATLEVDLALSEGATTYAETVTVGAGPYREAAPGVPAQAVLGSRELLALRGVIADDPFRAVQVLPAVATGDDFRAEFAVRGQGPQHIGLALDGIDSPLLFHTVRGVGDTGSLALINSDILESAALLTGAYPQRYGQRLGARLDVTTRDGARDRLRARALVSGSAATTVWEGPIGGGTRGSWLAAFRQSYVDWLLRRVGADIGGTFGFTDMQAKATLMPTPRQTLRLMAIAGRSALQDYDETPVLNSLDDARNRTLIGNLDWRLALTPRLTLGQQAYGIAAHYRNDVPDGRPREEGNDSDLTWRTTLDWQPGPQHQLTVGGQVQALRATRLDRNYTVTSTITSKDARISGRGAAAWLHYRWVPAPRLQVAPGVRVERWATVDDVSTSPWLGVEWQIDAATRVLASAGAARQAPSFDQVLDAGAALGPERARTLDLGVERRLGGSVRVRLTGYLRDEGDLLSFTNSEPRLIGTTLVTPGPGRWRNLLDGTGRGAELTVERSAANGLSGWVGYSFGRARAAVPGGQAFWADYDQRHGVNAAAIYRWSGRTSLSARWRWGSNFPIQGYVIEREAGYFVAATRNETRLPPYARLDVRADRTFSYRRSRLTLFVEVVNALGRANMGPSDGRVNPRTGLYTGLTEELFPLLPSAGILFEF